MGFRMSVKLESSDEWLGDDHKLYGYWACDDVKKSFDIICPLIQKQWKWVDETDEPIETYEIAMCCAGVTDELVVDEDTFRRFVTAYVEELKATEHDVTRFGYLTELAEQSGNKVLEWG